MQILYTIGYEGTDIKNFVATLKIVGVQRLADVRAILNSRKKGFSKKSLEEALRAENIEYLPLKNLGDPKPGRDAARAGQFKKFYDIYTEHLNTEDAQSSLKELIFAAEEKPTCLLCYERDYEKCHRHILATELKNYGFNILNLFGDNPERYVRNLHRMPSYSARQSTTTA